MDNLESDDTRLANPLPRVRKDETVAFSRMGKDYSTMNSGLPVISLGISISGGGSMVMIGRGQHIWRC
ncbi:hypothetical protein J2125_002319 [Erwinia toletana]|uniref:Uncharacterized protein n=1 Tax=Winslowiella toletana TaxID=92490 RepID=A0ABS4P8Z3_9GAMM|nr:hypothetical protein [Winslowiella toletana]MBP2169127.1 hypothetical protein [Winslowiella toletana]